MAAAERIDMAEKLASVGEHWTPKFVDAGDESPDALTQPAVERI